MLAATKGGQCALPFFDRSPIMVCQGLLKGGQGMLLPPVHVPAQTAGGRAGRTSCVSQHLRRRQLQVYRITQSYCDVLAAVRAEGRGFLRLVSALSRLLVLQCRPCCSAVHCLSITQRAPCPHGADCHWASGRVSAFMGTYSCSTRQPVQVNLHLLCDCLLCVVVQEWQPCHLLTCSCSTSSLSLPNMARLP